MKHHRPTPCPDASADAVSVHALGLDEAEVAILCLQRHFCRAFAEPASQAWVQAFALDAAPFAHLPQGAIALLVLTQVQAMRLVRQRAFRFNNPFCPSCAQSLTPDETDLVRLIQAARLRPELVPAHAARLSDGAANPGLEIATLRLAEALRPPRLH